MNDTPKPPQSSKDSEDADVVIPPAGLVFERPMYNQQCKVCTMCKDSEDLARLLHAYRFEMNMPLRELSDTMKKHIEEHNSRSGSKLQPFSIRTLSDHFNKHVPMNEQSQYQMQNRLHKPHKSSGERNVPDVVRNHIEGQILQVNNTFSELTYLFENLKGKYEKYDKNHEDIGPLTMHLDIIRELRSTLVEINKMKQSKDLVKVAVRSVVECFLNQIVHDCGIGIEDLREKLRRNGSNDSEVNITIRAFREKMVNVYVQAAKDSVERIRKEFSLE